MARLAADLRDFLVAHDLQVEYVHMTCSMHERWGAGGEAGMHMGS